MKFYYNSLNNLYYVVNNNTVYILHDLPENKEDLNFNYLSISEFSAKELKFCTDIIRPILPITDKLRNRLNE